MEECGIVLRLNVNIVTNFNHSLSQYPICLPVHNCTYLPIHVLNNALSIITALRDYNKELTAKRTFCSPKGIGVNLVSNITLKP